jgi:hypothetical protein
MLFVYSAIVMSSQSSDQYQLSAYLFIPVCIIAGGVALYLPSRLMLFSATLLPVVILNVLPRQYCLWDSLEAEREADRALRRLAATLPDDMRACLVWPIPEWLSEKLLRRTSERYRLTWR